MDESALKALLDNLYRCSSSLNNWLEFWTALVVVGVVLEVIVFLWEYAKERRVFRRESHYFQRGLTRSPEKPSAWLFWFGMLGTGLVAGGVAGELYIDFRAGELETKIRKANEDRATLLSKEAGDAKTSADGAAAASSIAKEIADALTLRMAILNQDIDAQGPRWRLLTGVAPELTKQLARFAGQRVEVFMCGGENSVDGETLKTGETIVEILGHKGAKWTLAGDQKRPNSFGECGPAVEGLGTGLMVFVGAGASSRTMQSAVALKTALSNVLPSFSNDMLGTISSDPSTFEQARDRATRRGDPRWAIITSNLGAYTPWILAARDPGLITILLGAHPQEWTSKTKNKGSKR